MDTAERNAGRLTIASARTATTDLVARTVAYLLYPRVERAATHKTSNSTGSATVGQFVNGITLDAALNTAAALSTGQ